MRDPFSEGRAACERGESRCPYPCRDARADLWSAGWRAARGGAAAQVEPVALADGVALQALIPGVRPVDRTASAIALEIARRDHRHGAAPMPDGGLFDECAKAQASLF